jgi:hypothetical protein
MKHTIRTAAIAAAAAVMLAAPALSAKDATVTGEIGDAECGVKHMAGEEAKACTDECVAHGSDYALIVNNMFYTLKADAATKAELAKLAGKKATVMGDENGTTIQVKSVKAAM